MKQIGKEEQVTDKKNSLTQPSDVSESTSKDIVDSNESSDGTSEEGQSGNATPVSVEKEKGSAASPDEKNRDKVDSSPKKNTRNNLREFRIEQMMSKAELARKAGLSVLTIDRIEKGYGCRMDTKRKILKALGLKLSDRRKVFKEE
ncbi:MAG: helix-turn-helix transcriptional regulator [Deltaproteobacteria bacterium]|nr:helix-turn-helix transcriptional regulator [Deltaproteobacteria bacterium]